MAQQLLLPGFESPSPPKDGLFFALFPEAAAAEALGKLMSAQREQHGLKGKPFKNERFHVSLYDLGTYDALPDGIIHAAREAAAIIDMPPFDVAFNHVMSFAGGSRGRPLVVCGDDGLIGLRALHRHLGAALRKTGLKRFVARLEFMPHVTLLYDRRCVLERSVEPITWTVREFVLVHSFRGETRYERKGAWPLRG